MRNLKEIIQHEVHFVEPKSPEHAFSVARKVKIKIWLLEEWSITITNNIMLPPLTLVNQQG